MADSESSGSTGPGARKDKARKLPYRLIKTEIKDVKGLTIGHLKLEKPSNLTGIPASQQEGCLYTLSVTDQHSLRILREIYHENILHSEALISSSSTSINLFVEKYTHNLEVEMYDFFMKKKGSSCVTCATNIFQGFIRQVIDGIDELILNGLYHGNLNLKSCYVDKNPTNGVVVVKLADFKAKAANDLLMSQIEDWNAVGEMVVEISNGIHSCYPYIELSVLNDLGMFLKNLTPSVPVHDVKMNILAHVFFWNKFRRRSFFIFDILEVLSNTTFIDRLKDLDFLPKKWISDDHDGVLTALDTKFQDGCHEYVKFVSAAYTHEEELKDSNKISKYVMVDDIIMKKHPRLCLELVKIVRELGFNV